MAGGFIGTAGEVPTLPKWPPGRARDSDLAHPGPCHLCHPPPTPRSVSLGWPAGACPSQMWCAWPLYSVW